MSKKYIMITAISHFRMRYCVPADTVDSVQEAEELINNQSVEDFSQLHISEDIIDTKVLSEEEMLKQFDEDNEYLKEWSQDQKTAWVYRQLPD